MDNPITTAFNQTLELAGQEAMEAYSAQGYLVAEICIGGIRPHADLAEIIADDANFEDKLTPIIQRFINQVEHSLSQNERLLLPMPLSPHSDEVINWCAGFIENVIDREADWKEHPEEGIDQLLMPMTVLSGLFESDEIDQMLDDDALCRQLAQELPENVTDLYLLCRVGTEDK